MNYNQALQAVDTVKALTALGFKPEQSGSYVYYPCTECEGRAVAKAYGEKKNLTYCTKCKISGHIIKLAEKVKGIEYEEAKKLLIEKAGATTKKIETEMTLAYELQYHDFLKEQGITEDLAAFMGIGVPKGKTMLAGCVAFSVHDETGKRIAYYGVRLKDQKPIHHKSFNPEMYLYALNSCDLNEPIILTTDMFECVKLWSENKQAVSNFALPYLSPVQFALLHTATQIHFAVKDELKKGFALQAMECLKVPYLFL